MDSNFTMILPYLRHTAIVIFLTFSAAAQSSKAKSYVISKSDSYVIEIKDGKPTVNLYSEEKKWIGDKNDAAIRSNRISYIDSFENISDIQAFSISPEKKKEKVHDIFTKNVEIENIFYHDMKYKFYLFGNLKDGSETYSSYKKEFKKPQFLDCFYFKDQLSCKDSKISLKVSNDVEIGYVLQGNETESITFTSQNEGNFTIFSWEMTNSSPEENVAGAPAFSYYSPHLIFYIKNYKAGNSTKSVLGSVENLYRFYYETVRDINKSDESELKSQTDLLIKGLTSDSEKARVIFDYVQSKINYVAFEDGMGGFIPREASEVFQKKYGDCKDMANLLNEMLLHAGIDSHIAWIGTRHNNYTYEKVPTPIADNHMIAVAKINNDYIFLDATGQYTLYPGFTPFIQGKQALLKLDENHCKIIPVPVVEAGKNKTSGKVAFQYANNKLVGNAHFELTGFVKSQFVGYYKAFINKNDMLKSYLSRFIQNIGTSGIQVKNIDDLSQNPLDIDYQFELDKWVKHTDEQLIFKPILFFPYADSRVSSDRKVPIEFDFKKSFQFEYEFEIPNGYRLEFKPENFKYQTSDLEASINYTVSGNKLLVSQKMAMNTLLLEKPGFDAWNTAVKNITKQYNQNIILSKL